MKSLFGSWRRLVVLVVFAFTALLSPAAQAESEKVFLPPPVGYRGQVKPLLITEIDKVLRDRLQGNRNLLLVSAVAGGADYINPSLKEAKRLFDAGRAKFVAQLYSEASKNFEASLGHLENNFTEIEDWKVFETTLYRLALSHFLSDKPKESKGIIVRLLAFNPDFELPTKEVEDLPDDLRLAYDVIAKRYRKQRGGDPERRRGVDQRSPGRDDAR